MIEEGVIEKIADGKAYVTVKPSDTAKCAGCRLCDAPHTHRIRLTIPAGKSFAAGEKVLLEISEPNRGILSLLVFGIPLAMLALGAWIGSLTTDGETGTIVGGFAGIFMSLAAIKAADALLGERLGIAARLYTEENDNGDNRDGREGEESSPR